MRTSHPRFIKKTKEGNLLPTIHAIISDLDDTLLDEHHHMRPRTEQTLKRLLARGIKVILASGRSAAAMRPMVRQIQTPYPYIAFNGAQIRDAKTDEVLVANEIPRDTAQALLAWFESRGIYAQYYGGDNWFCQTANALSDDYGRSVGIAGTETGIPLSQHITHDAPKVLAMAEPDTVPGLIAEGQAHFGGALSFTSSKPYFVEVTAAGANKGNAVRALAQKLDLSPQHTICAGDSLNDLPMLTWSRLPVTVANGREEVKAIAWKIAGNGHEDGLAILLDELMGGKEKNAD